METSEHSSLLTHSDRARGLCGVSNKPPNKQGLNALFVVYLWKILRLLFPRLKSGTLLMFLFLMFVRGAEEFNVYNVGLVPSLFYKVIDGKDLDGFKHTLWSAAIAVTAIAVCKSVRTWVASVLYVRWRVLITSALHKLYFKDILYYQLKLQESGIDNPDQRITQDVNRFCQELQNIVPTMVISPFVIAYYTYETYNSMGFYGPLSIYAFAGVAAVINKFLIGPVARAVFRQEAREGDFRYHHVQFRVNAESAAFYRAGSIEGRNANRRMQELYSAQHGVVDRTLPLSTSVNLFDYTGSILSYCLIGVPVFLGYYDSYDIASLSSLVSKNSFVSLYLLNNFSQLIDLSTNISDLAGYAHRIGELLVALRKMDKREFTRRQHQQEEEEEDIESCNADLSNREEVDGFYCVTMQSVNSSDAHVGLKVNRLSVGPPGWQCPILKDISFNFERQKNILIVGENGTGKSSLIKVLSGLWPAMSGSSRLLTGYGPHGLFVLPQKSYLTSGSLADQVCFPLPPKMEDEETLPHMPLQYGGADTSANIVQALDRAGILYLRDRLGGINVPPPSNQDWYDIISPGEAQCLAFSRLFYYCPRFAVLDEATSAMSEGKEALMYSTMRTLGITCLTVGHRSTLQKFHNVLIRVAGDGQWTCGSIDQQD